MIESVLPPLPVVLPMLLAALLLVFGHVRPARVPDALAVLMALGCAVLCAVIAVRAADGPLLHWFGGWTPRGGQALGIAFVADQASATMGVLIGVLFAAAFLFAWGYFDEVHAHFHVLMLLFLAAMTGFCLTHDLFNLFVWFEVMSIAAFALTAFRLEASALEGALNFTVVNSLGSYLMLGGIGLLYARLGALDFAALARGVAGAGPDPVVSAGFVLVAVALLIKASTVPFQFWLSDAHAVAPSPVSVIFSGAMVALGLFGLGKLCWQVFAASEAVAAWMHGLVLWLGAASAVVGGLMCLQQRHLKRMLAFSTISHTGVMLTGLATLSPTGAGGMLGYMLGHGLVKGALFMVAGILLATRAGIDEIGLRGLGRGLWPAGAAMALGGLLLAGLPVGLMDGGAKLIEGATEAAGSSFAGWCAGVGAVLTGGAVLRACGRIFLGWGEVSGEEERAPTEEEQEKADRPLWLMMLPCAVLLLLALLPPSLLDDPARRAVGAWTHPDTAALLGLAPPTPRPTVEWTGPAHAVSPWITTALALLVAGFDLGHRRLPRLLSDFFIKGSKPLFDGLEALHSGLVGDYVAWVAVGLALFAAASVLG